MWKQIALGAGVTAAVVGIGTAALATTGDTTSGSPTGSSSAAPAATAAHGKHPRLDRAMARRSVVHGQIVTQNPKTKQFVTHDVIRGSVTAVSSTSITVKASDNTSETFVVDPSTKVRHRTAGKPASGTASTIGAVKSGDQVVVAGTGTGPFTATLIVDGVN
jgi:hypothetical protein